jgi:hypothetical protein
MNLKYNLGIFLLKSYKNIFPKKQFFFGCFFNFTNLKQIAKFKHY